MIQKFEFEELPLKGSYKITPFLATDERGGLLKDYNVDIFNSNGIKHNLKETFDVLKHLYCIKDLENGVGFIKGLNKLKDMVQEGDIICSWAKDDIAEIIRNANYYGYDDLSWIDNYLDIQEYVTKILGYRKSLSLKNALKVLKIRANEELLHDALNDCIYTAHVFKNVYNSRAVKNYIVEDIYKMPALEVRALEGIELDYEKINQMCPKCQRKMEVDYPFRIMGWRFISLGTCSKCNSRILDELIVKKSLCGEEIYKEVATVIDEYDYLRYENKLKNKIYN